MRVSNNRLSTFSFDTLLSGYLIFFHGNQYSALASVTEN